jgi:hypothetical protein
LALLAKLVEIGAAANLAEDFEGTGAGVCKMSVFQIACYLNHTAPAQYLSKRVWG